MTQPDPKPIRKSDLPTIPSPEWEFHTWFPHPDGGGDMVPGERQRGVLVRRRISYSDWEPVRPDRWADEPPTDAAPASPAGVSPATDQTALRERLGAEMARADGWDWAGAVFSTLDTPGANRYRKLADAVLSVLPASVDRADVLREEAALIVRHCPDHGPQDQDGSWMDCHCAVADDIERRVAAETRNTTEAEDPARIDRLRPEFTEHSSVEAIDAQLRRARAQQRRWHLRTEWLISLRADRVAQKARGDWPAASEEQPATTPPAGGAPQPKEADGDSVVAYRLGGSQSLRCVECVPSKRGDIWEPVTSDDLPDGGVCAACGVDVLIPQQPKEA
jgi:hypothetical protein